MTTFADRLNRIDASNTSLVDTLGHGNADAMAAEIPPKPAPQTFNQRYRNGMIRNGLIGFVWMFFASAALRYFTTIRGALDATALSSGDKGLIMTTLALSCGLSILGMVWWLIHPLFTDDTLSTPRVSFTVGAVLGMIMGAGPVPFFNFIITLL